jgi:hypothetical protein
MPGIKVACITQLSIIIGSLKVLGNANSAAIQMRHGFEPIGKAGAME